MRLISFTSPGMKFFEATLISFMRPLYSLVSLKTAPFVVFVTFFSLIGLSGCQRSSTPAPVEWGYQRAPLSVLPGSVSGEGKRSKTSSVVVQSQEATRLANQRHLGNPQVIPSREIQILALKEGQETIIESVHPSNPGFQREALNKKVDQTPAYSHAEQSWGPDLKIIAVKEGKEVVMPPEERILDDQRTTTDDLEGKSPQDTGRSLLSADDIPDLPTPSHKPSFGQTVVSQTSLPEAQSLAKNNKAQVVPTLPACVDDLPRPSFKPERTLLLLQKEEIKVEKKQQSTPKSLGAESEALTKRNKDKNQKAIDGREFSPGIVDQPRSDARIFEENSDEISGTLSEEDSLFLEEPVHADTTISLEPQAVAPPSVESASKGAAAALKAPSDAAPSGASSSRLFSWPLRGKILKSFSRSGKAGRNDGLNIEGRMGDPVQAARQGQILYVGNELYGFGHLVLIKHDDEWMSAYAHLSQVNVQRGDFVKTGQVIGLVGSSGSVTHPQLHFEMRQFSQPVDPKKFLE